MNCMTEKLTKTTPAQNAPGLCKCIQPVTALVQWLAGLAATCSA